MEQVHGIEVVIGMAEMMGWSAAPTRALGRFEAGTLPKSLDEMYACATNDAERASITEMLFGSATDVLDRYLPDKQKHAALRGMLAFLAVNSTYRGPSSPGSAAGLAFGMAVPDENTVLTKKLKGGIGVLTQHLGDAVRRGRRRAPARVRGRRDRGRRRPRRPAWCWTAASGSTTAAVVSAIAPDLTLNTLVTAGAVDAGLSTRLSADRPPRQLRADALRPRRRAGVRGAVRVPQRPEDAERDRPLRHARGAAAPVRGQPARHRSGRRRRSRSRSRRPPTPTSPRRARPRRRRSRCGSRSRRTRPSTPGSRPRWASG